MRKVTAIDLEKLPDGFRLQRLVFQAARKAFAELSHGFTGTHEYPTHHQSLWYLHRRMQANIREMRTVTTQ